MSGDLTSCGFLGSDGNLRSGGFVCGVDARIVVRLSGEVSSECRGMAFGVSVLDGNCVESLRMRGCAAQAISRSYVLDGFHEDRMVRYQASGSRGAPSDFRRAFMLSGKVDPCAEYGTLGCRVNLKFILSVFSTIRCIFLCLSCDLFLSCQYRCAYIGFVFLRGAAFHVTVIFSSHDRGFRAFRCLVLVDRFNAKVSSEAV